MKKPTIVSPSQRHFADTSVTFSLHLGTSWWLLITFSPKSCNHAHSAYVNLNRSLPGCGCWGVVCLHPSRAAGLCLGRNLRWKIVYQPAEISPNSLKRPLNVVGHLLIYACR